MSISANFPNLKPSFLADFANSQVLDSRITFSRSTTAPYYDGKTSVLAEQNLVVYSQLIGGTGWTYAGANLTVATNATTAPDGTTTASTLTATGTSAQHATNLVTNTPTSPNYQTLSVYAQAGTNNFVQLCYGVDANAYANFNLSTGAVGTVGSTATATITQVGSTTWYRCTVTTQSATAQGFFLLICTSATATRYESNTLTTSINLWGAQLEQRSSTTAYNATTTTAITNYIPQLLTAPINAPRFDFNPTTGESLGLLIEQSSTNLLTYSQDFTNGVWTIVQGTIVANNNISPEGLQTASYFREDTTTGGGKGISRNYSLATGTYTWTIYAKSSNRQLSILTSDQSTGTSGGSFNLVNGTLIGSVTQTGSWTNTTASITFVGNNWYRCSVTSTKGAGTTASTSYAIAPVGGYSYLGDGYSGIFLWGAQLEALAFPTSYIATTSAQVTRASDNATMTGTNFSSWYNASQSSLYMDFDIGYYVSGLGGTNQGLVCFGTQSNRILTYVGNYASRPITGQLYDGTTSTAIALNLGGNLTTNTSVKVAFAFNTTTLTGTYNGLATNTVTGGNLNLSLNIMYLGYRFDTSTYLNGHIRKFAYYPQAVTSAQLQALTGS